VGSGPHRRLGECFASVPDAPSAIGFALAAHWQGALIWSAFGAQRPLDDYLAESLRTLISVLLRSPTRTRDPLGSEAGHGQSALELRRRFQAGT
jgi:hypothetical protein